MFLSSMLYMSIDLYIVAVIPKPRICFFLITEKKAKKNYSCNWTDLTVCENSYINQMCLMAVYFCEICAIISSNCSYQVLPANFVML